MSFILADEKRVKWPVYIDEPANGGKTTRRKIVLEFRIVDPSDWEKTDETVDEVLMKNIVGWDGIEEPDKSPVEFCDENLARLIKLAYVRAAIWQAYTTEVLTGSESKN